ncbi:MULTISPECIES: type IV pilus biogenesis protein PilP [unclassified Pseudomonas]|uniref:type IV pilus biogenesis protein PilP n=1 Tax=unclassified Pseudomonas TaxID=196821 RepID=UPI002AB4D7C6|nr:MULTISPECIES: type IV pilus biogenesis protein PilP [unclassified Pseudomonas]MDY7563432.1 type IV pilus biogenesis protein PilP [Pseudomonas sp. AB6]MEA9979911.1 type IV pilus biogenesis protein PilP [Pseudomonas sp. RTS4]MEA9996502.1 type IV pilus biogenesis protein PilP [Pseudomonas sp. AA4]MEB0198172.1 type IV pilus biogenesis protein PilP [Pseudomonas sp. 5S4]MEB0213416.1 type IV pilus biogenesis protein PilP [Pseudomonas sp. AB6]
MRNEYLFLPVLLAIAGLPRLGLADESTVGISVGELSAVQSETYLYRAQGERAKAQRAIAGEEPRTLQPSPYGYQPIQPVSSNTESLPVVKLVYGSSQSLRATLLYSGGFEIEAQAGGRELPGGYKVESISMDDVVLTRSGKRYPLGFSSTAPVNRSADVSSRMPVTGFAGLPGTPMPMGMPASTTLPEQP